jgi:hypothetical protein
MDDERRHKDDVEEMLTASIVSATVMGFSLDGLVSSRSRYPLSYCSLQTNSNPQDNELLSVHLIRFIELGPLYDMYLSFDLVAQRTNRILSLNRLMEWEYRRSVENCNADLLHAMSMLSPATVPVSSMRLLIEGLIDCSLSTFQSDTLRVKLHNAILESFPNKGNALKCLLEVLPDLIGKPESRQYLFWELLSELLIVINSSRYETEYFRFYRQSEGFAVQDGSNGSGEELDECVSIFSSEPVEYRQSDSHETILSICDVDTLLSVPHTVNNKIGEAFDSTGLRLLASVLRALVDIRNSRLSESMVVTATVPSSKETEHIQLLFEKSNALFGVSCCHY